MKRTDLEKYLGKFVEVKMYTGEVIRGCLRKTHDEMFKNNANLYLPMNYYFLTGSEKSKICISFLFRTSHVKYVNIFECWN